MKRRNVRTLSLIIATFTYLLIGAAVFDALEGEHNEAAFEALTNIKDDFMTKYNMTEEDYKLVELLMIERKPHKNGPQWKFAGTYVNKYNVNPISHLKNTVMTFEINMTRQLEPNTNLMTYLLLVLKSLQLDKRQG